MKIYLNSITKNPLHASMTHGSNAVTCAKADAKQAHPDDKTNIVRYCSVPTSLSSVLHASALCLLPHFQNQAKSFGLYRHIVSLLANYIVIIDPNKCIEDIQLFYTQVWGAVERYVAKRLRFKCASTATHFDAEANTFFSEEAPISDEDCELLRLQTYKLMMQQECASLSTAAKEHMSTVMDIFVTLGYDVNRDKLKHDDVQLSPLVESSVTEINNESQLQYLKSKLYEMYDDIKANALSEWLQQFISAERVVLQDLITYKGCTVKDAKTGVETKKLKPRLQCIKDKELYQLFGYAKHMSDASLCFLKKYELDVLRTVTREDDHDDHEGDTNMPCDESDNEEDTELQSDAPNNKWCTWSRTRRPRPFTLLPISKMVPSMAFYGYTELKNMFAMLRSNESEERKKDIKERMKSMQKRKRDQDEALLEAELKDANPSDEPVWFDEPCVDDIGKRLFNYKKVKGKSKVGTDADTKRWHLCNFRTNGVHLVLTFVSGTDDAQATPNVPSLMKAGYRIPVPKDKIKIDTVERGLYRVNEKRNDLSEIVPGASYDNMQCVVIDPGFKKPLQNACIGMKDLLKTPTVTALGVAKNAQRWHVTKEKWMNASGRQRRDEIEKRRRCLNREYSHAIDMLAKTRRRSSDIDTFNAYAKACIGTIGARFDELFHELRLKFKWKHVRKLQSFLDRMADDSFGLQLLRFKRRAARAEMDIDQQKLKNELQEQRAARREEDPKRRVVFFGDGTFKCTLRGNPSIPKKKLLKQMAVRGLTFLLGEYKTSLMCPCGHDSLTNQSSGKRVRVHKTDGGICSILSQCDDRDELATINMLCAVATALKHDDWPAHLCRPYNA